jgi:EAL domain-containing protein (putative c-di-GMP-specific phosphodiesterase class I)
MHIQSDLMLIVERDEASLQVLRNLADLLGCDRIEAESLESLSDTLAVRRPTIALLAVDEVKPDALAVLQLLAQHGARPATLLVGSVQARVLASAKRAAEALGITVIGVSARPLDVQQLLNIVSAHMTRPPSIAKQDLEQAIAEHELFLQYESKVAISSETLRIQGVEALVRWRHPRRGVLFPRHFLRAVEEHGLMIGLTDLVMTEAVRQAGQWRMRGLPLQMVINLSPRLVRDRAFPERLAALLREHDVPADQLVLDVAEAPALDDRSLMLDVFTRLRILGIGLSLDNFGTGMWSLTDLYRMPFSEIKVDHSLLADVPREPDAQLIVRTMADLAHKLAITVCAEGVETRDMLEFVRAAQFDSAQGRLFGASMSAADIERLIVGWPRSAPAATGTWRALQISPTEDTESSLRLKLSRVGTDNSSI